MICYGKTMNPQKVHPIVKPTYILRIVGWLFWGIVIISLSYEKFHYPKIIWLFLFVNVIAWPHIAYLMAVKSKNSRNFEIGNQLTDAFLAGIWLPIIQFSIWPTFSIIIVVSMNNLSVRGFRVMLPGIFFMLVGGIFSSFFYEIQFLSASGTITTVLCACFTFIYAIFIGSNSYRSGISMAVAKNHIKLKNKQLDNLSIKLSEYLPKQLVDNIADGREETIANHKREKLTMFFSDIKGFTSMTDAMEPEDMGLLLNNYLTEMDEIINKNKGTLAQVTGDSLFVFFGAPMHTNDQDHAFRCLSMAIEMQKKMTDLQKKWFRKGIDESFKIRCGINTGVATVGSFGSSGRKLYTAHGMQVNLAARLEQACEPGSILVSHSTWAIVNETVPCNEKGKISAKGYHKPIRIYEVDLAKIKIN